MSSCRSIALMTDFGLRDPYVAIMKAVILKVCPEAPVIDLSHEVESFSVVSGAYILYNSFRWFPRGTVFLVVVDPGVGGPREPIVVKTRNYYFVGPNNGVMYPSIMEDGVEEVRVISNRRLMLPKISMTFHGRDIFAPVAAWIACGGELEVIGDILPTDKLVKLQLSSYSVVNDVLCAKVVHVDKFGNVALSVNDERFIERLRSNYRGFELNGVKGAIGKTFSDVKEGEPLLIVNSFGHLELAVNKGSAKDVFKLRVGDKICMKLLSKE